MELFLSYVDEEYRQLRRKQRSTGLTLFEMGMHDELECFRQHYAREEQMEIEKYLNVELNRLKPRAEKSQLSDYGQGSLHLLERLLELYLKNHQ